MPHATNEPSCQEPWTGPQLYVNDGPLELDQVGSLKITTLDTPMEEIRRRYSEDGYVFLKQLLLREDVLKAREQYFQLLEPSGVLKLSTSPVQGIFNEAKDPLDYPGIGAGGQDSNGRPIGPHPEIAGKFVDLALQAHGEDWYKESFCKHPALLHFVKEFTGWKDNTLAIKRTLLRNNTPGNKAIGVHYDQIFLRHGDDSALTAWVPMGGV
jgi:phytanoyl-CoA hydroxylase